jgi:membrane-associated phospholipid phosphatase
LKNLLIRFIEWLRDFFRRKLNIKNEDLPYYVTIAIALIIFIVALNGFIEITDELAENELGWFDSAVTGYVQSFRSDTLTAFFKIVTDLGDRYAYITISILLGFYFVLRHRSWKFTLQTILVLLLATVSNIMIKRVINRGRPSLEHLVDVNTLSYPSGHSMSAMAFYGFLVYLTLVLVPSKWLKAVLSIFIILLILSIGTSRIYLGVHYPSDVAAGFVGGLIWVTLCIIVFNTFSFIRKRRAARSAVQ